MLEMVEFLKGHDTIGLRRSVPCPSRPSALKAKTSGLDLCALTLQVGGVGPHFHGECNICFAKFSSPKIMTTQLDHHRAAPAINRVCWDEFCSQKNILLPYILCHLVSRPRNKMAYLATQQGSILQATLQKITAALLHAVGTMLNNPKVWRGVRKNIAFSFRCSFVKVCFFYSYAE